MKALTDGFIIGRFAANQAHDGQSFYGSRGISVAQLKATGIAAMSLSNMARKSALPGASRSTSP